METLSEFWRAVRGTDWTPAISALGVIILFLIFARYMIVRSNSRNSQIIELMKDNNRLLREYTEALKAVAAAVAKLKY